MSESVIEGWRGVMVSAGLGTPMRRGVTAAMLAGLVSYTLKRPYAAFDEEGSIRPHASLSPSPRATGTHFLLMPLAVGTATALFT